MAAEKILPTTIFLILLGALFHGSVLAQTRDDRIIEGLFDAAAAAVGSKKEIAKVLSIEAIAACDGPKGKYTTTVNSYRDNRTFFAQTYSYRPAPSKVFINEDFVWEQTADGELEVSSPFQRMAARMHEYQKMVLDLPGFFSGFEYVGDSSFGGHQVLEVKAKNELDMVTHLYFEKAGKRFIGYQLDIPNSNDTVKNVFTQWRMVGKLNLPSEVKAIDKDGEWTLGFHTIRLNRANKNLLDVPPRIADLSELMRLHERQKTAHLTYNAEMFIDMFAENVNQLQRGVSATRTRDENLKRFKSYFSTFRFAEWEDIAPPVIRISKDGTLATKIVQKRVRGTYKNDKGEDESDHTVFAWLEVWEKIDGVWKVVTVASTDKDGSK